MANIKLAVILAAGLGIRLPSFIRHIPKGFLGVKGVSLIERSLRMLLDSGIEEIIIGTGYQSSKYEALSKEFPQVRCVYSAEYASTGSMYTLYNLRKSVDSDFLLLESDILYEKSGLVSLLAHESQNVILASGLTYAGDEVYIEAEPNGNLVSMSKDKNLLGSIYGELTGLSKVSFSSFQTMCSYASSTFIESPKLDYEYAIVGIRKTDKFNVLRLEDFVWCEIDDEQHLHRARNIVYPRILRREQAVSKL